MRAEFVWKTTEKMKGRQDTSDGSFAKLKRAYGNEEEPSRPAKRKQHAEAEVIRLSTSLTSQVLLKPYCFYLYSGALSFRVPAFINF